MTRFVVKGHVLLPPQIKFHAIQLHTSHPFHHRDVQLLLPNPRRHRYYHSTLHSTTYIETVLTVYGKEGSFS